MKLLGGLTNSLLPSSTPPYPSSSNQLNRPSMGMSCPCFGSSQRTKHNAHRSYARVIDVPPPYFDARTQGQPIARMPERMRSTASLEHLIEFSEKEKALHERRISSSSSSIVSHPSTHITSNLTGSTFARNSIVRDDTGSTAPPSYHSASRSCSPSPPSSYLQHPVMTDDWFRVLQQRALEATTRPEAP